MLTESHAHEKQIRDSNHYLLKGLLLAAVIGASAFYAFRNYESKSTQFSNQTNHTSRTQTSTLEE
jgi:hypothetical protein